MIGYIYIYILSLNKTKLVLWIHELDHPSLRSVYVLFSLLCFRIAIVLLAQKRMSSSLRDCYWTQNDGSSGADRPGVHRDYAHAKNPTANMHSRFVLLTIR